MTRASLRTAIKFGISKAKGKTEREAEDMIIDAVEMAFEIERETSSHPEPTKVEVIRRQDHPVDGIASLSPPPAPSSVQSAPEIIQMEGTDIENHAVPEVKSLIHLADESVKIDDVRRQISAEKAKSGPIKIRSLNLSGKAKRPGMEELMQWCQATFPREISFIPKGKEKPVTVEIALRPIPMAGEVKGREKESSIKVCYRHPSLGTDMEIGVPIRCGDIAESMPDPNEIINRIKAQGIEMYKQRPRSIESSSPDSESLYAKSSYVAKAKQTIYGEERGVVSFTTEDGKTHSA